MLVHKTLQLSEIPEDIFELSRSLMQPHRLAHVNRFKNINQQKSTLAGEWLVRSMLSEITGKSLSFFKIDVTDKGKPYISNFPNLYFNISHSGDFVTAAVSYVSVGVDIEVIRPHNLNLVKRVCTDYEAAYVFGHIPSKEELTLPPSPECVVRFLEIWTVKEAYFKCTGTGILDFKSVNALNLPFNKQKFQTNEYIMHIVSL